jgi:nitrogen fixation/metabolism regulation signal transduction histidine kinase
MLVFFFQTTINLNEVTQYHLLHGRPVPTPTIFEEMRLILHPAATFSERTVYRYLLLSVWAVSILLLLLLLLLLTAIELSLGGSSPYTSADITNKRYT